jgi:hypothetical protein
MSNIFLHDTQTIDSKLDPRRQEVNFPEKVVEVSDD